jgi:hypothetical protein
VDESAEEVAAVEMVGYVAGERWARVRWEQFERAGGLCPL